MNSQEAPPPSNGPIGTSEYGKEDLDLLRDHISMEISASIYYRNVAALLSLSTNSLHGFAALYRKQSTEEYEHADRLIEYLTGRDYPYATTDLTVIVPDQYETIFDTLLYIIAKSAEIEELVHKSFVRVSHGVDVSASEYSMAWIHNQEKEIMFFRKLYTRVKSSGATNLIFLDHEMFEEYS